MISTSTISWVTPVCSFEVLVSWSRLSRFVPDRFFRFFSSGREWGTRPKLPPAFVSVDRPPLNQKVIFRNIFFILFYFLGENVFVPRWIYLLRTKIQIFDSSFISNIWFFFFCFVFSFVFSFCSFWLLGSNTSLFSASRFTSDVISEKTNKHENWISPLKWNAIEYW
jgi:hypothetical protein